MQFIKKLLCCIGGDVKRKSDIKKADKGEVTIATRSQRFHFLGVCLSPEKM